LSSFCLVLASRSPQRKELLRALGIPFRVVVSAHDEGVHDDDPRATVEANARGKAREVMARELLAPGELVLGVDTVVVVDGRVLGKARDPQEARAYLRLLAGRRHEVYSGLCLGDADCEAGGHARTSVTFRSLDEETLARYVATDEWRERAGAYAVQGLGSTLVTAVDGDYFNVVGLPVALLVDTLARLGVAPLSWATARG
jgi:septum formation protein